MDQLLRSVRLKFIYGLGGFKMVKCADCNYWYRAGSTRGECRCKKSDNWKKTMLYNDTCEQSKDISVPVFFSNYLKCSA